MNRRNKTNKIIRNNKRVGGKAYGISGNVKLSFKGKKVTCDVCKENDFKEKTGSFGKSKLRAGLGQAIFGESAEVLDTTSVIIYVCNNCGLCKIIRNKDPLLIIAEPL